MKHGNALILTYARYPVPGKAKTRLIPSLGPEAAARLHRRLTEHAVAVARTTRKVAGKGHIDITLCYTGASKREFRAWLGTDLDYVPQPSGDLGTRMRAAFHHAFKSGFASALLIGSDAPGITPAILLQAIRGLRDKDIVLGPAADGGYYLIGMNTEHPALFRDKDWGTDRVYKQTWRTIRDSGLRCLVLPELMDVDRPGDLPQVQKDPRFEDAITGHSSLSIVIPTINESTTIGRLLRRLGTSRTVQCIVADGGSEDDTTKIASQAGAEVMNASGGRAAQQNAGAKLAKGRLLFFLHADTLPPRGYAEDIRRCLDCPETVAGAFRFKTDATGAKMRLIEQVTNLRSGLLQCPYGDQGLFMEKRVFEEMGGFAPLPIMEDFELVRRLRHRGTVVTLGRAAITSARRWQQLGVIRTTLINQVMILGFHLGLSFPTLQRLYRNQARRLG